jgi:hypothetical protein
MPAPLKGMQCSHCVYYEKTAENFGECRRYAPHPNPCEFVAKINAVGVIKTDIHWPKVYDATWCGQFSARKSDQVPADVPKEAAVRPKAVIPPDEANAPKLELTPEAESPEPPPGVDIG